mgnify:CR=1 FL=1
MLSMPIKVPEEFSYIQKNANPQIELQRQVRKKLLLFINCLMKSINFKTQLKKLTSNLAEIDKMKSINGLRSYQKDLVKFSVFMKHHDV